MRSPLWHVALSPLGSDSDDSPLPSPMLGFLQMPQGRERWVWMGAGGLPTGQLPATQEVSDRIWSRSL